MSLDNPPFALNLLPMWQRGHTKASGYGRIIDCLDGRIIERVKDWTFTRRAIARIFRPVYSRSGSGWYHRESFMTEMEAARYWFKESGQVFHFFYGEQCYRYLGYLKKIANHNAIVCTYHTPPDKFRQMVRNTTHLKYVDAIIVLSTMQVDFFADIVDRDRVFYVPRSVDTDYFVPAENKPDIGGKLQCLFVGHFLRDFETLAAAVAILNGSGVPVHTTVVTPRQNHHYFSGLANVTLLSDIPDQELLQLYQQSNVFVATFLDATANNAVVEAMSCGLPIISNNIPGVKDYVTDECAILTPQKDARALADAIALLHGDNQRLERMRKASRLRALDFSISMIAQRTFGVYEQAIKPYI